MGEEAGLHSFGSAQAWMQKCNLVEGKNEGQGMKGLKATGTTEVQIMLCQFLHRML